MISETHTNLRKPEAFHVHSTITRRGIVFAYSSLHAVAVATSTGLHKKGTSIVVNRIDPRSLPPRVKKLYDLGQSGRVAYDMFHPLLLLA